VSDTKRKTRFRRYARVIYGAGKRNFAVVASVSALAFGGLTLLLYAVSIGQLPEFTWNDLTGTLLAVCVTGALVVAVVVAYCLCAGYFARSALEAVYPEAAYHVSAAVADPHASPAPYALLIRGRFISGATCFSILAWVGLAIGVSTERLIWPYEKHLVGALVIAFVAVTLLLLIDWRRFRQQWLRYALLSILCGAIATLIVIITAWSVGPDKLVTRDQVRSLGQPVTIDWTSYSVRALDHAIAVGLSVAIAMVILFNLRTITSHAGRFIHRLVGRIPFKMPSWLVLALGRASHVLVGAAPDRRLIKAKVYVTAVFCLFTIAVFTMAYAMAAMGNAHEWSMNFFFIVTLLTVLNWASFSVGHWRGRAGLGLVTAALVFISYPVLVHNPIMFPKMIVSLLGLGNERLASVALSSKQCATLAPYGVSCVPDSERTITLTNVNLLNRLGSSIVLELLIRDADTDSRKTSAQSALTGATPMPLDRGQSSQAVKTLLATSQMGSNSPSSKFCDGLLLSQLESSDAISAKALRCVELVVPKDQVLGYTKSNWRNYRGEYTAYQPGRAKAPMVVEVIADEPIRTTSGKAAISAVSTKQ
jgi:hypothetical protein